MKAHDKMQKGSIQLIPFPFTDLSHKKVRPCIVLAQERDDIVVVFITSVKPKDGEYISVVPSKENGIKQVSYIRYTKIATLDQRLALGEIGVLEGKIHNQLRQKLKEFLA